MSHWKLSVTSNTGTIRKEKGSGDDIGKLKDIAFAMKKGSLCGLGQTSPNPVISTLNYFPEEYNEKIRKPRIAQKQ
jgi:NADH:ubiquinone oxidoreductase subunit F (NADH-binding)